MEWKRLRLECFKRDKRANAVCHICGQPIDYSLKPSSTPDAYEPDHLIARAKSERLTLAPDNIAASHRRCNRRRGKKAVINGLGNQSRAW